MGQLDCRPLSPAELSAQLAEAEVASSRALPGATVYDLKKEGHGWLVVALPDGSGLSVDLAKPPPRRRRIDSAKPRG